MQIKIMKKLHLEAKFSNFRMALVPFKNLQRLLQEKFNKHLKISKKDPSRVAKFVSHNGISAQSAEHCMRQHRLKLAELGSLGTLFL